MSSFINKLLLLLRQGKSDALRSILSRECVSEDAIDYCLLVACARGDSWEVILPFIEHCCRHHNMESLCILNALASSEIEQRVNNVQKTVSRMH
jgi:hypothetical protein